MSQPTATFAEPRRAAVRIHYRRDDAGESHRVRIVSVGDVTVSVDLAAILSMLGDRALNNKSGKARFMKGAVLVTARNVTRTEDRID